MANLKLAFRTLSKTPFFTAVAVLSLALGLGANAAIFSLFDQLLLRPLPVAEPGALVNLAAPEPKAGSMSSTLAGDRNALFSFPMFRDLERIQTVFTGIAAHRLVDVNLAYGGATSNGEGMLVSGSYFSVLGVRPALGRLLGPEDDRTVGESQVVVLAHGYWESRFGRARDVLGRTMVVNGRALTIVGVAERGFDGTTLGAKPQVFVPITMRGLMEPGFREFENRRSYWVYLFARLRPGVSIEQARAAVNAQYHAIINEVEAKLQTGMSQQTLARFKEKPLLLGPGTRGQSTVSGEAREPFTLLFAVSGLVLVIACANIANLLLARAAGRAGEMAVRLSIGASRRQLVAQLLTESCLLAACGGACGLVVARWSLYGIGSLLPSDATWVRIQLDGRALVFSGLLALGTGLLFGLFPALHGSRADLLSALKGQAGQPSGGKAAARFRASLATLQIALSMALLVAAGLFTRSLANVSRVNLGLEVQNVVTFRVSPQLNGYTPQRSREIFERLEDELAALPGVTGVTDALIAVLAFNNWGDTLSVESFQAGPDADTNAHYNGIGTGYFRTLGTLLVAGRDFTRADTVGAPKVAMVNEAFAGKFNLGRDAVGKRFGYVRGKLDTEIVGVVQNAKYGDVKSEAPPTYYRPYRQNERLGHMNFYVRTSTPPEQFLPSIPKLIARLDPNLPVERLHTMTEQVRDNVSLDRFISVLSAAFAGLATLLAAMGLYGVLAYTVAQRTREIGLRMALGATPASVAGMVLRQVGIMTVVGGAVGITAAVWLCGLAKSLLYQLQPEDPAVLVFSAVALSAVALTAAFVPARRASRVDPMRALRYE